MQITHNYIYAYIWQSTLALLPGKSHGWRSLIGYSPWGRKESDTTEWLHFHFHIYIYIYIYIYIHTHTHTHIHPLPFEPPNPSPIPPLQVITELQAGPSVLYSSFSPAIYFRGTNWESSKDHTLDSPYFVMAAILSLPGIHHTLLALCLPQSKYRTKVKKWKLAAMWFGYWIVPTSKDLWTVHFKQFLVRDSL